MPVEAGSPQPPATDSLSPARADDARRPLKRGSGLVRLLLALVALAAIAVASVLVLGGGDDDKGSVRRAPAAAASLGQLNAAATSAGHPVYWAGAQDKTTYELTQTKDGRIFIRYLPTGAKVGDGQPRYLTVGTYPQAHALATLTATARAQGVKTISLPGGGRAFQDARRPTSAYLAVPGADVQVEVFDPQPGRALDLVRSGRIAPFRALPPVGAAPKAVTAADLRALAGRLGQPIYWAGEKARTTYELTQTADGRVYVRYLPSGVSVDTSAPDYLTVGTYPLVDAVATSRATAARAGAQTFDVGGGGLAFVDEKHPNSVYVAWPGADVQVEAYDAHGGRAVELLRAGQITAVR